MNETASEALAESATVILFDVFALHHCVQLYILNV